MLADYLNKRNAPYIIWTLVFLACAIFFWLSRSESQPSDAPASQSSSSRSSDRRRRRMVSMSLDGTLLGAAPGGAVTQAAVEAFLRLCGSSELFTIAQADSDAREAEVRAVLESIGAFGAGLKPHRVMFSSSLEGRASMVRQLQPALHLDAAKSVTDALEGKVTQVRLVGSAEWPTLADGARLDDSSSG